MPQFRINIRRTLAALGLLLAAAGGAAQPRAELDSYVDLRSGFRVSYPKGWRRAEPAEGPTRLVIGEPPGEAFVLCSIEQAPARQRISTQARLDRDLVRGFKSKDWPQQLAGPRRVLDYQVREIGGVPMGAVDWEGAQEQDGRPSRARGIKVFRTTPTALWTAECASIAATQPAAEAHFALNIGVIGDIIGSVRFPR